MIATTTPAGSGTGTSSLLRAIRWLSEGLTASRPTRALAAAGLLAVATLSTIPDASAQRSFSRRFPAPAAQPLSVKGDIVLVGNHTMSCNTSDIVNNCPGALDGSDSTRRNNNFAMIAVNVDPDGGANANSSTASLSMPSGSTVLFAGLYWGGVASGASRSQVRMRAPGSASFASITATTTDSIGSAYQSFADVTSRVAAGGNGAYTVGNLSQTNAQNNWAGWTLVVAYRNDATGTLRNVSVYDGYQQGNTGNPQIDIGISGFYTPPTGPVNSNIGLVLYDGDRGQNDDAGGQPSLLFGPNTGALSPVFNDLNPQADVWNSSLTVPGASGTAASNVTAGRSPASVNLLGVDIDNLRPNTPLVNGSTSAVVRTRASDTDVNYPGVITLATDVFEPEIVTSFSKTATSNGTGGRFRPGDTVTYTVSLENRGNDNAINTRVTDPLPTGVTFVPGSLRVLTGANAGAKTDVAGDDQGNYDAGTRTVTFRVGTGANATTGGTLAPTEATSITFQVTIDAVVANGTAVSNVATVNFTSATSGQAGSGSNPPAVFTVTRNADLAITKTGPANVRAGDPVTYIVTASNAGADGADGATVSDDVPDTLTAVAITCAASGGAVCPATAGLTDLTALAIPTFPSGGSVVFTITGTAPASGSLSNVATVAAPANRTDPTPANNTSATVATTITPITADLSITKTRTSASPAPVGSTVSYTLVVTNGGPDAVTNAQVSDTLPAELTGVSITCVTPANCTANAPSGNTVSASVTLANGASTTIQVSGTAPATTATPIAANTATVTAPAGVVDAAGNNSATSPAIPLTAGPIVAVNDAGVVTTAGTGGTAVPNVLVNDTLGGAQATTSNVTISLVSSTNAGVTINTATGAVSVSNAVPAGNYVLRYRICETSAPASCAEANVTVPVTAGTANADDDTGTVVTSATGGQSVANVLVNDELGAVQATTANVTITLVSSSNAGVTLNTATGAVNVAAGTPAGTYTLVYRICETAIPTNCDNATVTVPVTAGTANADDDTGAVVTSATGGQSVANVLVNDELGAIQATTTNVTLSLVSSSNAGVTLDTATGAVNVAAGTPAGTYTLVYRICETAIPTNCDNATVTVPVTAGTANADDDTGTVVTSATGGQSVANVLVNDELGAIQATTANVTITLVSSSNAGVTLDTATGAVNVAAGTPAGTYTLVYRICETAIPTNCDNATVTVPVSAGTANADDDTGVSVTSATGGQSVANVLVNDELGAIQATTANVTITLVSSTNAGVTINTATGAVNVAAGTPAGTYTLVYRICETAIPTNCDDATVTVPVTAGTANADDDTGTVVTSATGGQSVANVLVNDELGAVQATTANVALSLVSSSNAGVTLDTATGAVNVAAGTPAGTYTLVYRICETAIPTNCDNATVTVPVTAGTANADDDTGTVVTSATGGQSVANVLVNDELGAIQATTANVTITLVSSSNAGVTLDTATGAVNVAAGTPAGTYTLVYRICETAIPTNCDNATVTVPVSAGTANADDDTGVSVTSATGGQSVANVLVNDELGAVQATTANVTITLVSSSNAGVTLNTATGAVNVAAGTPAGTYTLVYRICETAIPTNCDDATVTVPVTAGAADAVNDSGNVVTAATGGQSVANVLVNDALGLVQATTANVTITLVSSSNAGVTLDTTTGAVNVAAGTPAGNYTLVYRICETSQPTNCDTATVSVPVTAGTIVANNDTGVTTTAGTGGTAVPNVLVNDTLGGAPANTSNVTITLVSSSNPGVTLNTATGAVDVSAAVPAGSYTLVYRICETNIPGNCSTATVTVPVSAGAIVATNDAGATTTTGTGGTAVASVLANDTLGGAPATTSNVTLSLVSSGNPGITLDPATGAVIVAAGTPAGAYTLVYRICETSAPTNCATATVNVPVSAGAIVATDDSGAATTAGTGGTAVSNVLVNDTLAGAAATTSNVTISLVSSSNAGVTLNTATGAVNVSAAVPAGVYTLVYRICETTAPTNCANATVTVPVSAGVINAVEDSGSAASAAGGVAIANVRANDTLNGVPVTAANVITTFVSSTDPRVTLDPATGAVSVAPGTPSGIYSLVYRICEVNVPANCDTTTVTVFVSAGVIDAVNDTGSATPAGGIAVADVRGNDTLNGVPVTPTSVDLSFVSSTNAGVTLDTTTGAVSVAPGTPAGSYTLTYRICEANAPSNCDTAVVTVTVSAGVIDAVDDTGAVASAAGGNAVVNVLGNDTLAGAAATTGNVVLSLVSSSNPGVTLDIASGAVNVAPGTAPGTYTLVYRICEAGAPGNCDTATVTVTVSAGVIDAIDDIGTTTTAGGVAVANVLGNDTLAGAPATTSNVVVSQVSSSIPGVTLDVATGAVNVAAGTPAGTYTLVYRICETALPGNCDTATVTVTVAPNAIVANDDAAGPVNGSTGGDTGINVIGNDTLNGAPIVLGAGGNATLAPVTTGPLTVNADGTVTVAPGSPAGTYTISYTICELANPANCDTATVTVTVAAAIVANDDTAGPVNGATGGDTGINVVGNDTLNGAPIVLGPGGNATLAPVTTGPLTVNADGTVTLAPGTPAGTYTISYTICELANPANCDTAFIAVSVAASVINAFNDLADAPRAGGVAVETVLVNDLLADGQATARNVVLSLVSSSSPGITLDLATGAVSVVADLPMGSYRLVYRICEAAQPDNCDDAVVVILAADSDIVANDDISAPVRGSAGGDTGTSVIGNDTLNGGPVVLGSGGNATLAPVTAGPLTVNADGTVTLALGTPAGTYTISYTICEVANPSNCDTATVSVTVIATPIVANPDVITPANTPGGGPVGNVLDNDTVGGGPATGGPGGSVILTPVTSGPVTVNADGTITIAPSSPAGTYTVTYTVCEVINPSNCASATVTVTIEATALVATDDTATTVQNTPVTTPVLGNDTRGGAAINPAQVTVTIATQPARGSVRVNADGTITYTPAANTSGTDTYTYTVCETANPSNCDTASVSVNVPPNVVNAIDDAMATPQSGAVLINVIGNDTSTGAALDPASLAIVGAPVNGTVAIGPTGTLTYTPKDGFSGTDTFTYRICDRSVPTPVCDTATVTVNVQAVPSQLRISKQAATRSVRAGDLVRYTVVVENVGEVPVANVTLLDVPPAGFTYAEGSLAVDDGDDAGALAGTVPLRVTGLDIAVGQRATVSYVLRVGAGVGRGTHTNRASAIDVAGNAVGNVGSADVEVEGDALTDTSLIVGSVFDDVDGNGIQGEGERGIPGVRIASVEGLLIETDGYGRYHLEGVDLGSNARGRNFILKVDVATLPPGTVFTTENPRVRRVTPGTPVRFDFGVRLPPPEDTPPPGASTPTGATAPVSSAASEG